MTIVRVKFSSHSISITLWAYSLQRRGGQNKNCILNRILKDPFNGPKFGIFSSPPQNKRVDGKNKFSEPEDDNNFHLINLHSK